MPLVSAIVLNTWAGRKTVACVRNLQKQTLVKDMDIFVVDNHSQDDSIGTIRNNLKTMNNVKIVETHKNLGFGGGYGLGIRHAQGRYILINNPDKLLEPTGIEQMVKVMEADPNIGIIAPRLIHEEDGTVRSSARAFPRPLDVVIKRTALSRIFPHRVRRYLAESNDAHMRDVDWVVGGCFMIRADLMNELNGFDPRFFLFFEDIDLCRRTWNAGKRVVYMPTVTATDRKRRFSEMPALQMPLNKVGRAHIASAIKYFWKWRNEMKN